jgi:hypothetical protein
MAYIGDNIASLPYITQEEVLFVIDNISKITALAGDVALKVIVYTHKYLTRASNRDDGARLV